ncbi:nitrate- and nitrite sensing domain-containing protein [Rhizobacter sp. Root1221]|uniref:nitrate- and nitrite sensing domain-containing protein n=1 Tax=Rhizobacter sp. Root1221 TaxID=1736433 RepID=UPI0006F6D82B|nr:nitrate- and nitrite sensing domain-containing protein [Rhizobacter sp. Root1221]KQV98394.1 antitermination regulator [Rhizobacter sp. Root1221]
MPDPAVPLSVSTLVLRAKQLEIDAVRHLASRAELVDVIGQLIQALQRERGASSIFLASQGQRFTDVRRTLVDEARPVETRVRDVFAVHLDPAQGATAKALSLMAWALLGLDALEALRTQIERQALTAHDSVAAYSHLIAGLIELVFHVADAAVLPSVSRLLVAILHLVQAQEAAGQERAVGALLYASGLCDEAHQQRVIHLIDAQERSLQVFAEFAEPALRARWEQQQLGPGVAKLERLRRTLCAAKAGATLDSNLSDTWFDVCTDRINELWQLQVALVKRLREDCETRIVEAQQDLQDSRGLLKRLRDNPPARTHAVDRFFDIATMPGAVPELVGTPGAAESPSLLDLLQAQSARMAGMEAELDAARRALNERKVIERAKGVLMARLGMNEEAAFRALQKTSMDQNRRLLDVAEATLSLPDFAFPQPAGRGDKPA